MEIIYLSLHCHHQNDSCIKMSSGEINRFKCFINCEGQSHKTCPQTTTFEENYQPSALPLGQTGSLYIYIPSVGKHGIVSRFGLAVRR